MPAESPMIGSAFCRTGHGREGEGMGAREREVGEGARERGCQRRSRRKSRRQGEGAERAWCRRGRRRGAVPARERAWHGTGEGEGAARCQREGAVPSAHIHGVRERARRGRGAGKDHTANPGMRLESVRISATAPPCAPPPPPPLALPRPPAPLLASALAPSPPFPYSSLALFARQGEVEESADPSGEISERSKDRWGKKRGERRKENAGRKSR
ncbi:oleosin-B6-like [Ananas comosus]|uniref:Oleosin-B6-like n=1 Tax=Ananas comosus TaxID=4615 RepID=A0A6P5EC73_ANACO|nr:oleosin-B6-like [Ananas comosus]